MPVPDCSYVDADDVSEPTGSSYSFCVQAEIRALKVKLGGIVAGHISDIFVPASPGAVVTTVQNKLREFITPADKGAIGDGITDDLAAFKLALEGGYPVDGCGKTYAIDGTCAPTSFKGLFNAKLVQIGDNSATNIQTLKIVGISDFFIRDVTINMGSNIETLFSDDGNSGLYVGGADYETFIERFVIDNVSVTGNGCGSGIQTRYAKNFAVSNCIVHDRISGASPDPTNDSQDGIQFVNCHNFTVSNCRVSNLKTRLSGTPEIQWTRGFLFAECVDFAIGVCSSELVDQAYDFSGAYVEEYEYIGNRDFVISGSTASDAGTYGFKFANVTHSGLVSGCVAHNIGSIGFVVSCAPSIPAGLEPLLTHNIDFVGCKAINMFGTGGAGANATGFRVMAGSTYTDYPRGIRFKDCRVEDDQDIPTTLVGFHSDVALPTYNTTDYDVSISNYVQGCSVDSSIATPYNSIGPVLCQATGTGNQAISNASYTEILWDTELSDFQRLHNPASNQQNIYIKEAGLYKIIAQLQFDSSAVGFRAARLLNNGSVIDRTTITAAPVTGGVTSIATETAVQLKSGDYVSVAAYQSSGGALNVKTNESYFSVIKVD